MIADLEEIINETADQSENILYDDDRLENNNIGYCWICTIDYSIYITKELMEEYNFSNDNEIIMSGIYIPLLIVDIVEIEKSFIKKFYCDNEKSFMKLWDGTKKNYQVLFNIFMEDNLHSYSSWISYRNEQVKKLVIPWCIENSIPFK